MMAVDDRLKDAAKNFLTASSIFDKVKTEAVNLKTADFGVDLTEQNLLMCSHIMKALAQYCAYEKIKRTNPEKFSLLSRLSLQASIFFGLAYSISSTPPVCTAADAKNFVSIIQFKEYSFMAQAYYWAAMMYEKQANDTAEGIGKSVASIRKANSYLDQLKKLEKSLSPVILSEYREMVKHYTEKKTYLEGQNSKIYHEQVPTTAEEIEPMVFGQPVNIEPELSKPFEGKEIFAHFVPPAVRILEEEYKTEVATLMNQVFQLSQTIDTLEAQVMEKNGLPAALHAVSGEQSFPEDLWAKIKACKEKGGIAGLKQIFSGVDSVAENNGSILKKLLQQVQQEEEEDTAMRTKYGTAWNRLPSSNLNQSMKKQLEYYSQRFEAGRQTDEKIKQIVDTKKDILVIIDMDKSELTAKIPKSLHAGEHMSPAAMRLTELLKTKDALKKECETETEGMMKILETEVVTNEMFQVHQKIKDKKTVRF
jgi:programmed cell death 6-interacting protein